ncbi:MAG TPA: serine/threonine-protein kinase [Candidatus Obscuribacter sp.]|nr:serine/threonine protein kinase [Candidatus Obscuribacter sp.]HMW92232.1 serine/threonine-protein kinase [Candidatus Obscuribacter sp.]HMY54965.1 serine/threonine-protein kinase [Candidatus Obscuribacter sp.]HND69414.1 serine/threonine-protein kinase [Candidatus Obscuribacter sp.]HNG19989.1 serine/threonine-protein kinase [Candidatus Obscuribacter sp.]
MSQSSDDPWFKRYRWLQMLGTGGMGVIYLAQDLYSDDAFRVVKHLSSTFSDPDEKAEAIRLFRREAAMLQRLNHPGVVRFHDHYFTEEGKYYLVMDYVPGSSLETVINDFGPFNDDDAVKVGIQICEVLEYLHDQDPPIIYRDLKPSNLMLTPEGQIVFIDFGIARNFMPKESATRVVTAGYSPPEQYFGKPETRSDIYALGATLGHLLTGTRPKPLTPTTVSQHKPDVLPSLDALVKQMTSHAIDERPPSARHVRHLLYRCYQELHPEFEIPDEVFKARTITTTREEQFISQRIMKSGMKAAASALKFEQDNERKRRNSPEENGSGTFDRLRGINREGGTTNPKNQRLTSSKVQQVSSSKLQKVSSSKVQKVTGNRDDARNSKGSLRSVRDLKKTEERGIFSKLFGWLGGRKD